MAPFNNRQIGYIQAIAGRQQHVTLRSGQLQGQISSGDAVDASLKPQTLDTSRVNGGYASGTAADAKSLLLYTYNLDQQTLGFDSRTEQNNNKLEPADFTNLIPFNHGFGNGINMDVFNASVQGSREVTGSHDISNAGELVRNPNVIPSTVRATPDGFLNSTDVKFRFTLPTRGLAAHSENPMGASHYEFRWIVWRNKRPTMPVHATNTDSATTDTVDGVSGVRIGGATTMEAIRDGCSFRNPCYDFFKGQTGRKRGFLGYTLSEKLDAEKSPTENPSEQYSGYRLNSTSNGFVNDSSDARTTKHTESIPVTEAALTVDDLLTMRLNRDDYVIMKDVRFFLGKEHGKSHFEDVLHWDWNDPIDTPFENVLASPTLNDKNYRWHMTLIGTSGGDDPVILNQSVRWTTKMESG